MTYPQYLSTILQRPRVQFVLIVCVVLLAYSPIFSNTFVWDDKDTILNWPAKQEWSSVPRFLAGETPPAHPGNYRPLRNILYIANHKLYGTKSTGYQLQAIAIEIGCSLFLWALLRKITKDQYIPVLAGVLFAVHPVHVEAIAWMTSSMDMSGVLAMFASLYFAVCSLEKKKFDWKKYCISVLLSGAAFFTNEVTLTLPFLLIILIVYFRKQNRAIWQYASMLTPYFLVLSAYGAMRILIAGQGARSDYLSDSFLVQFFVMCHAFFAYIKVLIFPISLSINHSLGHGITSWAVEFERSSTVTTDYVQTLSLTHPVVVLAVLCVVGSLSFAWYIRKKSPLISFSIVWFFASFVTMSNLIPTEAIMVERFLFVPSVGFVVLMSSLIVRYLPLKPMYVHRLRGQVGWIFVLLLVPLYIGRTYVRVQDWRSDEHLWRSTIASNPYATLSRLYFSEILLQRNDVNAAIDQYVLALRYNPQYPGIRITLATLYDAIGRHEDAIQTLQTYESAGYLSAEDFIILANSYRQQEKYEQALQAYSNALKLSPGNPTILNNIGAVHAILKNYPEAREAFLEALQSDPGSQSALQNLKKLEPYLPKN